jgi:DNA-directed RNA polymerase subunit M
MPKSVGGKKQFICSCGFKHAAESVTITESAKEKPKDFVVVETEPSTNIIIDADCPKCGPVKAEYWEIQTRSADEPATRFHKCTKCGHTWRDYK